MADLYVYHSGSNTAPYDTWAKAANLLVTAGAASSAGDTIIVAVDHLETGTASVIVIFPSVNITPVKIYSANRTTGAYEIATSIQFDYNNSGYDMTFRGSFVIFGLYFSAGDDINTGTTYNVMKWHDTTFEQTGANSKLNVTASRVSSFYHNCNFIATNTSIFTGWFSFGSDVNVLMQCCTITSAASHLSTSSIFISAGVHTICNVVNCDFSGIDSGRLVENNNTSISGYRQYKFTNCVLNSSTTTLLFNNIGAEVDFIFENIDSANTVYRRQRNNIYGALFSETGIYRTAGASNGTTNFSDKIVSNVSAVPIFAPVRFKVASLWVDVSTAKTFTVEFAQDGTTTPLTDAEIWIEVDYPDDTTSISLCENDRLVDISGTPVNQTTSTEAWTGLSGTNVKQKCSVTTSNTGKEGPCNVWINVAKTSTTVYVDPKVDIS